MSALLHEEITLSQCRQRSRTKLNSTSLPTSELLIEFFSSTLSQADHFVHTTIRAEHVLGFHIWTGIFGLFWVLGLQVMGCEHVWMLFATEFLAQ